MLVQPAWVEEGGGGGWSRGGSAPAPPSHCRCLCPCPGAAAGSPHQPANIIINKIKLLRVTAGEMVAKWAMLWLGGR